MEKLIGQKFCWYFMFVQNQELKWYWVNVLDIIEL